MNTQPAELTWREVVLALIDVIGVPAFIFFCGWSSAQGPALGTRIIIGIVLGWLIGSRTAEARALLRVETSPHFHKVCKIVEQKDAEIRDLRSRLREMGR